MKRAHLCRSTRRIMHLATAPLFEGGVRSIRQVPEEILPHRPHVPVIVYEQATILGPGPLPFHCLSECSHRLLDGWGESPASCTKSTAQSITLQKRSVRSPAANVERSMLGNRPKSSAMPTPGIAFKRRTSSSFLASSPNGGANMPLPESGISTYPPRAFV